MNAKHNAEHVMALMAQPSDFYAEHLFKNSNSKTRKSKAPNQFQIKKDLFGVESTKARRPLNRFPSIESPVSTLQSLPQLP